MPKSRRSAAAVTERNLDDRSRDQIAYRRLQGFMDRHRHDAQPLHASIMIAR